MAVSVVAGRDVIKTDAAEVIERLEETLERVKSGDLQGANRFVMYVVNDDVDTFEASLLWSGRAVQCLGYLDLAKENLRYTILEG